MLAHPPSGLRLCNAEDAAHLLAPVLSDARTEAIHAAHVDRAGVVLAVDRIESFHCRSIELPVRRLMAHALTLGSTGLVIAHNHPSGDPEPSRADIAATRVLVNAARALEIRVLDHLIFTRTRCTSFRARGLL